MSFKTLMSILSTVTRVNNHIVSNLKSKSFNDFSRLLLIFNGFYVFNV